MSVTVHKEKPIVTNDMVLACGIIIKYIIYARARITNEVDTEVTFTQFGQKTITPTVTNSMINSVDVFLIPMTDAMLYCLQASISDYIFDEAYMECEDES